MTDGHSPAHDITYPRTSLTLGVSITCVVVLSAVWLIERNYSAMRSLTDTELRVRWLAGEVMRLDEVLTMSARMAAATGDATWEARYRRHAPELDARIREVLALAPKAYAADAHEVDEANRLLVEMEQRSFELRHADDRRAALALLESPEYGVQKRIYSDSIARSNDALVRRASARLADQKRTMQASALVGFALCIVLAVLWRRVTTALGRHDKALTRATRELAEANESLELRVQVRTAELTAAHGSLKEELARRLQAETELRQAQKLESVGRLASGVAHEINTPMQFVSDSIHFVRDATEDLAKLIDKYRTFHRSVAEGGPVADAIAEVTKAEEDADLPYLLENIPKALDRSLDGAGRVVTIVRSMTEFAHPDQKEMCPMDLNQAIRSTLTISRSEYKYIADVETDLGDVPLVTCHGGDVNQAILNVVVNAAHAIGERVKGTDQRGRITIRTRHDGDCAMIGISDTGGGIPDEIRDRIFDPFFTTKDVGRGTGQGLAISRFVIHEKHNGNLTFETDLGKGTTFFIRLPIDGGPKAMETAA